MADIPITIIAPTTRPVLDGTCTRLRRRRDGSLANVRFGDRLWLREQFYLAKMYEHCRPTQALERGATPVFAIDVPDLPDYATADLGRRRFARELPRLWHRAHLQVAAVNIEPINSITDEEIAQEGFASRSEFIAAWNAQQKFSHKQRDSYAWGGHVLVISFHCIQAPIGAIEKNASRSVNRVEAAQ